MSDGFVDRIEFHTSPLWNHNLWPSFPFHLSRPSPSSNSHDGILWYEQMNESVIGEESQRFRQDYSSCFLLLASLLASFLLFLCDDDDWPIDRGALLFKSRGNREINLLS